ncbi:membrane protein [Fervidicella metallireducens AeB]|uniref:Membrane protein n=1 Tax=Fervidicella metallireducens AeB TaxID=1403537 RepID=A0A017RTI8_9CLOT|nr:DMT family transporter [Fervidicella metallireducens]EYE87977.1 membrane protein [Fervidicella metallireducens AeB]
MHIRGYIYAIISAIFFGSAGIFVKNGYSNNFTPVDLLMLQYIIAGVILFFICLFKYKKDLSLNSTTIKKLLIQGAIGNTLMTVFFYSSFKYLEVSVATMLLYTYPAMVALFSFLFFGEKITRRKATAIIGTFLGCVLVLNIFSFEFNFELKGILFGILSAVFYSFMNIYAQNLVDEVPPIVVTFYTTIFSLLVLIIFNFNFIEKLPYVTLNSLSNAALLAFFCEIIPLTLLYGAIKYIGPVITSIISTLEIPSAAIFSYFIMGEKFTLNQISGIVIIVFCVILLKKDDKN